MNIGLYEGWRLNIMVAGEDDDKNLREVKAILRGLQRIGVRLPQVGSASKNPDSTATTLENPANRKNVSQPPDGSRDRAPSRTGVRSGDAESLVSKRPVQGRRLAALALTMLAAGTVIVLAGDLFLKYWPSVPPSRPASAITGEVTSAVVMAERPGAEISRPTLPVETRQSVSQAGTINDRAASLAATTVPASPDIDHAHELMDSGHIVAAREMLLRPDLAASQDGAWLIARSYDPNYLATIKSADASADKRQAEEWYRRWRDIALRNGLVMDELRLKRIISSMQ